MPAAPSPPPRLTAGRSLCFSTSPRPKISQASIPQFIEDNWLNGQRIGGGSFDATTGSIADMFNFNKKNSVALILDPSTGTVDDKTKNKN